MMSTMRVLAPATTANLGPGYDCLGLALDLWNELEVFTGDEAAPGSGPVVEVEGEGAGELAQGGDNLVARSMAFLFREAGRDDASLAPVKLPQRDSPQPGVGQLGRRYCRGAGRRQLPLRRHVRRRRAFGDGRHYRRTPRQRGCGVAGRAAACGD